MSAIDNKHLLEIINIVPQAYEAKNGRAAGTMYKAQCVCHGGDEGIVIGQLVLPRHLKDTKPGKYLAEFRLGVNFKLEVVPMITALHVFEGPVHASKSGAVSAKQSA